MLVLIMALSLTGLCSAESVGSVEDSFILLPGGVFLMGSPDTERQRQADETQHAARLP